MAARRRPAHIGRQTPRSRCRGPHPCVPRWQHLGMRVGIAHHFGWAVAVTATPDFEVVDRRRIELIEPGLPVAPIHHEGGTHEMHRSGEPLDDDALAALVAEVRQSVVSTTGASLEELENSLSGPITAIAIRGWPADFPQDIATQRRPPFESRADSVMYCQVLAGVAATRGWSIHTYDAKRGRIRCGGLPGTSGARGAPRTEDRVWARHGPRTIGPHLPQRSSRPDDGGPDWAPAVGPARQSVVRGDADVGGSVNPSVSSFGIPGRPNGPFLGDARADESALVDAVCMRTVRGRATTRVQRRSPAELWSSTVKWAPGFASRKRLIHVGYIGPVRSPSSRCSMWPE